MSSKALSIPVLDIHQWLMRVDNHGCVVQRMALPVAVCLVLFDFGSCVVYIMNNTMHVFVIDTRVIK